MAVLKVTAQSNASTQSAELTSTKIKVVSNVAVYYATGIDPSAYAGNCILLPANTIRDINVGPGQLEHDDTTSVGNVTVGGTGPKVAFVSAGGTAGVTITEIGFVDFTRVTN